MEKKTEVDEVAVGEDGTLFIRFSLYTFENGVQTAHSLHRTSIPPGVDPDFMINAVNLGISRDARLKAAPIEQTGVNMIKQICAQVHTKEVVDAYTEEAKKLEVAAKSFLNPFDEAAR